MTVRAPYNQAIKSIHSVRQRNGALQFDLSPANVFPFPVTRHTLYPPRESGRLYKQSILMNPVFHSLLILLGTADLLICTVLIRLQVLPVIASMGSSSQVISIDTVPETGSFQS